VCYEAGSPIDQVYFPQTGTGNLHDCTGERHVSVISAPRFELVTRHSAALGELIFDYIETLWAEAQQNAACNAIHDGSSRLCRWLLQCADRIGSEQLLLTQEFLAEMLGVRRTTVTLLAQELQKRGILRYSRGRITILDRAALEALACDCYEVIKKLSTVAVRPTSKRGFILRVVDLG
jgi:hypothetical protein